MTLILQLPPEMEARLREHAAAAGKEPEGFVLDALQEKLRSAGRADSKAASPDEWVKEWRTWAANHPRRPFQADDSRESLYAGCGE